jgi:DnaJ-class molecular chaperone
MGFFVILGIVAAFGYYLSLKIYPFTKCKICDGRGRHYSTFYENAHRKCSKCGGTGRRDRLGVRLFVNKK